MSEWTEGIVDTGDLRRIFKGSSIWSTSLVDFIGVRGADFPSFGLSEYGFRVAAAIPSPMGILVLMLGVAVVSRRHR